MTNINLEEINQGIADRSDVFYWQTDRKVDPEEAGHIWADRHRYFSDKELVSKINPHLENKISSFIPLDLDAQLNLGNVNSVRVANLESAAQAIVRLHPKGIVNGYFHAESEAAKRAKELGLPSYSTFAIHDFEGGEDFAFHAIEKLQGTAVIKWLEEHPEDEDKLLVKIGEAMAKVHQIKVGGFGPFDNQKAKQGKLQGLHSTFFEANRAGLDFNLKVLTDLGIFSQSQAQSIDKLFSADNPLLQLESAVLVHNDFADWNLLTDGNEITGILDWDECVAGSPISDIACWSTFFEPERMQSFLKGYWQVAKKPTNFDEIFELLRLRYTISKMTLRLRKYEWSPSRDVKEKIEVGKIHLKTSLDYFGIK